MGFKEAYGAQLSTSSSNSDWEKGNKKNKQVSIGTDTANDVTDASSKQAFPPLMSSQVSNQNSDLYRISQMK